MRAILAASCRPHRLGFVRFEINGSSEVLVLVIHVEAPALGIDRVSFGLTFEGQFFFLSQGLVVESAHRLDPRRTDTEFLRGSPINSAAGGGIDVSTGLPCKRLFIDGANA